MNVDKTLEALTELTKSLKLGDGMDPATNMGPLINMRGLEKVSV